jgi:molecular chaperone GrpE
MVNKHDEDNNDFEEITDENIESDEFELEEVEELSKNKLKDLRDKIARLDTEKKEILEESQRARAEFLNAKKRLEEERVADRKRAQRQHAEELLPLCDSFQMAMSNKEVWEKTDKSWRTGVEGIQMQLMNILNSYGVKAIDPTGEAFDPQKHEAIGTEETEDEKMIDAVVSVIQMGYEMTQDGDTHTIRPARVTTGIAKG